jgi:hypothetical protein
MRCSDIGNASAAVRVTLSSLTFIEAGGFCAEVGSIARRTRLYSCTRHDNEIHDEFRWGCDALRLTPQPTVRKAHCFHKNI